MYDEESASGLGDADLEMSALIERGNRAARLRKRGICSHDWTGPKEGGIECLYCQKVFATETAMEADRDDVIATYF